MPSVVISSSVSGGVLSESVIPTTDNMYDIGSSVFRWRSGSFGTINGLTVGLGKGSIATNTAVGASVLATNTTGSYNLGAGYLALSQNTTGAGNVAVGAGALPNSQTGDYNAVVGDDAANRNTTGSHNTAIGTAALYYNLTADGNTALGSYALNATTAASNTAVGGSALLSNTTGTNNVAVGYNAGYNGSVALETLSSSVFIGKDANSTTNGLTNMIVIGSGAQGTASNQVTIGNASVTDTYCGSVAPSSIVHAKAFRPVAVTYANRPATPVEGMLVPITDSNTATWGATIAGGGANHVLGYYNGSTWMVAAA